MPSLSEQREGKISQLSGHPTQTPNARTEAVQPLFLRLPQLATMPLVDSCEELADAKNFFCVNGNIRSLSGCASGWFCVQRHRKVFNRTQSGDRKVKLTVYHDARIGKAVPFSLLAWADDHKGISQVSALEIGAEKTNLQPGEEIPWMPLGLRNKCVSVMKRTVQNNMSGLREHHWDTRDLTCIYIHITFIQQQLSKLLACAATVSIKVCYALYHIWLNQQ